MQRIFSILSLAFLLAACEVIDPSDRLLPVDAVPQSSRRHVLLEFTGFRCVNCPSAEATALELQSLYAERLIVIALHPASNPFTKGVYDYTCPAADSVYRFVGGTASTPFPTGCINLTADAEGHYFRDHELWGAALLQAMQDTVCPSLALTASLDTAARRVDARITYSACDDMRLALWLIEDSVVGAQAMPDGSVLMDYTHRHVLRTSAFDTPFGVPALAGATTTYILLPDGCDAAHCSLVAPLLDATNYHILNAYETKLSTAGSVPDLP
jgi:hypothetical protein